jgi:hypothetical protein
MDFVAKTTASVRWARAIIGSDADFVDPATTPYACSSLFCRVFYRTALAKRRLRHANKTPLTYYFSTRLV